MKIIEANFSDEVFNVALALSLEWGENFHQPIGSRLRAAYPEITEEQTEMLHHWCREVERYSFELIEKGYQRSNGQNGGTAIEEVKRAYPQINAENLSRLYSQGMYYAWHG